MSRTIYISLEQAIDVHRRTIEKSGGGTCEIINTDKLDSALEWIQSDDYYPTFEDKLTHLCFSTCNCHCFMDGNKRLALTLSAQFLLLNGYMYCVEDFMHNMENIVLYMADGKISKELLKEIIVAILVDDFDNESLKMKIVEAVK